MIRITSGIESYSYHGVSCIRNSVPLSKSDEKELLFWSSDSLESPQGDVFDNLVHKSHFVKVFNKVLPRLELIGDETILEMGGGHCWASALIKRHYPNCYVVASDLSPDAVRFLEKYETILGVTVDETWAFNSRHIPFDKGQFDLVFTFAAFHHFGEGNDFGAAIREMIRVLRPAGKLVLLYEPSSPQWLYKWAFQRVNRRRASFSHVIDEDVLVLSKIRRICERLNCRFEAQYFTSYEERIGIVETVYYYILTQVKLLRRLLPCTVNVVIEKM
jgi:SAM-dependent methyltransferase